MASQPDLKKDVKGQIPTFRLSLRYKLAFPVVIFVFLMLMILFYTTFQLVRGLVVERIEERFKAVTDVFAETLKVPLLVGNNEDVQTIMEWMAGQQDVIEVRLMSLDGDLIASAHPDIEIPDYVAKKNYYGVSRIADQQFAVAELIEAREGPLGRVIVLFTQLGLEDELKSIFQERLLLAFVMLAFLAVIISVVTWIGIRPLFTLEKTAKRILAGDLDARADIHSFDEVEDLGSAFNEMVSRLATSLDRLRNRTEALEESEEKFRLVVENANDIIFTLSPDGELFLLNKGFSGVAREEFLREGLPLMLSLHTEETRQKFQTALEEVVMHKAPVENVAVTQLLRGVQSEIFYLVNLTPVIASDGEVKLIQGVMRDITEFRRIEMMKESLVRDVAHELKTPAAKFEMTLNWLEAQMKEQNQYKAYEELFTILRNNVDRLTHTIASIMDLSKLESGVDQITREEFNLNEVLEPLCKDFKPMVEIKNLSFNYKLSKKNLKMMGDKHMLYRLFSNLLQNSIKFTEEGKITLESKVEDGGIMVEVVDTGMGIDKEHLETIFDRFVQKTASSMGIGVGLTISRDIVALHNGRIWAESSGQGKGAIIRVLFPML